MSSERHGRSRRGGRGGARAGWLSDRLSSISDVAMPELPGLEIVRVPASGPPILHVDADAFYTSVEQRDDPALRDRPVAVVTDVVCCASYEARAARVRSGMSEDEARARCPELLTVAPRSGCLRRGEPAPVRSARGLRGGRRRRLLLRGVPRSRHRRLGRRGRRCRPDPPARADPARPPGQHRHRAHEVARQDRERVGQAGRARRHRPRAGTAGARRRSASISSGASVASRAASSRCKGSPSSPTSRSTRPGTSHPSSDVPWRAGWTRWPTAKTTRASSRAGRAATAACGRRGRCNSYSPSKSRSVPVTADLEVG